MYTAMRMYILSLLCCCIMKRRAVTHVDMCTILTCKIELEIHGMENTTHGLKKKGVLCYCSCGISSSRLRKHRSGEYLRILLT